MRTYRKRVVIFLVVLSFLLVGSAFGMHSVAAHSHITFSDTSKTSGYGPGVYFIADNGWVSGYTDVPGYTPCANAGRSSPCFLPDYGSTRGQVSKMIVNAKV